jgi:hypothetical protein
VLLQVGGQRLLRNRNFDKLARAGVVVTDGDFFVRAWFGEGGTGSCCENGRATADQAAKD